MNVIQSEVRENSWEDRGKILADVLAAMKHQETRERSGFSSKVNVEKQKQRNMLSVSGAVQGLVTSYLKAPMKSKDQQILSSFAYDFTHKTINELCFKCKVGSYLRTQRRTRICMGPEGRFLNLTRILGTD